MKIGDKVLVKGRDDSEAYIIEVKSHFWSWIYQILIVIYDNGSREEIGEIDLELLCEH